MDERKTIQIGEWTAAPATGTLTRGRISKKLGPRAMDVLVYLANSPDRVVSIQELISAVWRNVVVTDNSVYLAINQLRSALDDRGTPPRYLVTIPRRGYRLIAPVTRPCSPASSPESRDLCPPEARARKIGRLPLLGIALAISLLGIGGTAFVYRTPAPEPYVVFSEIPTRLNTESPEAEALFIRATDLFFGNGSLDSILALLDRAIEIDEDFVDAYYLRADAQFFYGRAIDRDDVAVAITRNPALAKALAFSAWLHDLEGDAKQAEEIYKVGSRLHPSDSNVLTSYARFLRSQGRHAQAIAILERAVRINPHDFDLYHQLGIAYRYAKQLDLAVEASRRSIAIERSNPLPHLGLAYSEIARGKLEVAERELRLAEELGAGTWLFRLPQMAYAYSQLGLSKDVDRLAEAFRHRAADATDSEWAVMHLALGEIDRTYARFKAALANQGVNRLLLTGLKNNYFENPVLEEPRFRALRDKVGAH